MTEEEKNLLLKDLCARLPYGVKIQTWYGEIITSDLNTFPYSREEMDKEDMWDQLSGFKPYLRPLSSMTEEERAEFREIGGLMSYNPQNDTWALAAFTPEAYDWLNSHYFDYRGLIEMDLANPLEEMNKKSNQ